MIGELLAVTSLLLFPIATYIVAKKIKNDAIDDVLGYLESDEGLKYIYKLGVVAGSGVRQGVGLGKKGGKFSMEDIVGQAIGGFIQNIMPQQNQPSNDGGQQTQRKDHM